MSRNCQQSKNNFSSVLPDIVANFKTAMCNPYTKQKATKRSQIPVLSTRVRSAVRDVVPAPVRAAKQAPPQKCPGLPQDLIGSTQKRGTASSKIPKLNCPKVSQLSKRGPSITSAAGPKRNLKTTKSECSITATNVASHQNLGPWPYGIPPCSRYETKWGDPAYTGSYIEGEWCYDVLGAAPRPMGWPDMSHMFPDIPRGIFELRSVEPCAASPELSPTVGKPVSGNDWQETSNGRHANTVQSREPASRNAVRDNTSSVTGPTATTGAEFQGKDVTLSALPCHTNTPSVTQPTTTVRDQPKVTSFHSDGAVDCIKHDNLVKSVAKARDIKRCDNRLYDRNLYKLFSRYPSTDVHKRGIKRTADDCVEPSFVKKIRTKRQD